MLAHDYHKCWLAIAIYKKNSMKSFCQHVETKTIVSAIIRGEESTLTKHYSITAITLCYILSLSHNALCCGETLLLVKVITLGKTKPLSLLIVVDLVKFFPLSLLKVIALTAGQKQ
jgi:hypothetical protein